MSDRDMDWGDLRFVLETVRHGGLSGAARALKVNHATVARRIAAAEAALGTPLFDRRPTGYVATRAGEDAARTAEAFEAEQATLNRSIAARDASVSGPLTVTAPQLMFQTALAPILGDFMSAHPDVQIKHLAPTSRSTSRIAKRMSRSVFLLPPTRTSSGARLRHRIRLFTPARPISHSLRPILTSHWTGCVFCIGKCRKNQ